MAKIAFVQEALKDRQGIMMLSAVLKEKGHKCTVFSNQFDRNIIRDILAYKPDIIAFSSSTSEHIPLTKLARKLKLHTDTLIIFGGNHPTFFPEIIEEDCIDAICIGEGEYAFLEFVEKYERGKSVKKIKNIWVKEKGKIYRNPVRKLVENLDKLPFPDRDIYYEKYGVLKRGSTKHFMVGRGCPFQCSYCFNAALQKIYHGKGKYVRFRSAEHVINEIKQVREKYGFEWVLFGDDTINTDKKWLINFLDLYKKEIGVPFLCNVRIENVDEELVRKLKWAGVDRVNFGIEHGDEEFRKKILNRQIFNEQILKGAYLFKKYDIRIWIMNITGFPTETVDDFFKTVELNNKINPETAICHLLQPYPKTQIFYLAKKVGYIDESFNVNDLSDLNSRYGKVNVNSVIRQRNIKELLKYRCFFNLMVKYKWTIPLVKNLLVKLPYTRFHELLWLSPFLKREFKYAVNKYEKKGAYSRLFKFFKF